MVCDSMGTKRPDASRPSNAVQDGLLGLDGQVRPLDEGSRRLCTVRLAALAVGSLCMRRLSALPPDPWDGGLASRQHTVQHHESYSSPVQYWLHRDVVVSAKYFWKIVRCAPMSIIGQKRGQSCREKQRGDTNLVHDVNQRPNTTRDVVLLPPRLRARRPAVPPPPPQRRPPGQCLVASCRPRCMGSRR